MRIGTALDPWDDTKSMATTLTDAGEHPKDATMRCIDILMDV